MAWRRVARAWILAGAVSLAGARLPAQGGAIADAEAFAPPTPQRLTAIHTAAQRDGWAPHRAPLRAAALRAYENGRLGPAGAWLDAYRWAALFGQTEAEFVPRWASAVQALRVGHANMARQYETRPRPLAAALSPTLQAWLFTNSAFSAEFFGLLSPVDNIPRAFAILDEIHRHDPARFKTYASLAAAIALVYDVPPPPDWPHGQVSAEALPRQFPAPANAFDWWVRQDQRGRTYHRLSRLGAAELRFVVDTVVPLAELEWAQGAANLPLNQLARAYTMVRYRNDRVTGQQMTWAGRSYALAEILATGGICSDQAFFAAQAGKARGVPTLLIYGAGRDGRHAWFGFLDGGQKWQLDAGRYAEQRFVTGYARDPQTLARQFAIPGTPGMEHRIGGLESANGSGNISYDPANHDLMVRLRQEKIAGIEVPDLQVDDPTGDAELLLLGWGSSYGPIGEACRRARRKGIKVAHAHLQYLNPFPGNLEEVLKRYPTVVAPEMNLGQLALLLRGRFLVDVQSVTKVQGMAFLADEIEGVIDSALDGTLAEKESDKAKLARLGAVTIDASGAGVDA